MRNPNFIEYVMIRIERDVDWYMCYFCHPNPLFHGVTVSPDLLSLLIEKFGFIIEDYTNESFDTMIEPEECILSLPIGQGDYILGFLFAMFADDKFHVHDGEYLEDIDDDEPSRDTPLNEIAVICLDIESFFF